MDQLSTPVPVGTRLRLAHGALELIAQDADAPVLHVKGEALHEELATGRRRSTDCDVLVHPDRVDAFCAALEGAHWRQLTHFAHGSVFMHAATFHHDVWGTVDVHRSFPGLELDPTATFTAFWADRTEILIGGVKCAVPSLEHQRLLLLVHAARDSQGRAPHDLEVGWTRLGTAERAGIDAVAEELGAMVPIALVTGRPELARGGRQEHLWTALHTGQDARGIRLAMLRDVSTPRDVALLLREVARVNPDHLALRLGHPPTRQELRREWWARWPRWFLSERRFPRPR